MVTHDALLTGFAFAILACPLRGWLALAGVAYLIFQRRMEFLDVQTRPHE